MTKNQLQAINEILGQLQRLQEEFDLDERDYLEVVSAIPFIIIGGSDDFLIMMANLEDPSVVITRGPDEEEEDEEEGDEEEGEAWKD